MGRGGPPRSSGTGRPRPRPERPCPLRSRRRTLLLPSRFERQRGQAQRRPGGTGQVAQEAAAGRTIPPHDPGLAAVESRQGRSGCRGCRVPQDRDRLHAHAGYRANPAASVGRAAGTCLALDTPSCAAAASQHQPATGAGQQLFRGWPGSFDADPAVAVGWAAPRTLRRGLHWLRRR